MEREGVEPSAGQVPESASGTKRAPSRARGPEENLRKLLRRVPVYIFEFNAACAAITPPTAE